MEIYDLLEQDHRLVEELFTELEATGDTASKTRQNGLERLSQELSIHMAFEEEHLYPRLKEEQETEDLALEAIEEHKAARALMDQLRDTDPVDETWIAKLTVLKESVLHHVEEEEDELFPKARELLEDAESKRLGELYQEYKSSELGRQKRPS